MMAKPEVRRWCVRIQFSQGLIDELGYDHVAVLHKQATKAFADAGRAEAKPRRRKVESSDDVPRVKTFYVFQDTVAAG